jgi:hypothetical protein
MRIAVKLAFDEEAALRLLNWLAAENALILRARPDLPLLYDSGVVYRREPDEVWCDYLNMLAQGHEDCDGLAAARAGELVARGFRALGPGEHGYAEARRTRPASIPAQVMLRTRAQQGQTGLYHCIVRYRVAGRWYRDDPSARLGMNGPIDPAIRRQWEARAATPTRRTR